MIKRVEYYDIHHNQEKANIVLTDEIDAVSNDIYICLAGNANSFVADQTTKDTLNRLYRELARYKNEGKF